jgi:hypothetical protein
MIRHSSYLGTIQNLHDSIKYIVIRYGMLLAGALRPYARV